MSLLLLDGVSKGYGRGSSERLALHDVSLELQAGELISIWGARRSGRSTLLRIACGIQPPDEGTVRFQGRCIAARGEEPFRRDIAYCRTPLGLPNNRSVLDRLTLSQFVRGASRVEALSRVRRALARTGAERCAALRPSQLSYAEAVRVTIARALAGEPKLLAVDEPSLGVELSERDDLLRLLRSLADEGIAVMTSTDRATGFLGADRAFTLDKGRLRGQLSPALAPVVQLRRPA